MGLDFSKPASQPAVQTQPAEEAEVVEQYDIVSDRQQMNTELTGSPEVDALVSQIEVHNLETIVSFGAEAAEEISKCSDIVLNNMNMSQLDDSSEMLNTLAKIMSKFDIDELKENPGWARKWTRSTSSLRNMNRRLSRQTVILTKCSMPMSIITMNW